MQKKPTKDKAKRPTTTKRKADKTTPGTADALTSSLPIEPTYEAAPVPSFPVSFCIIVSPKDTETLQRTIASLPKNAEICVLLNKPGDASTITPESSSYEDGRLLRWQQWTFERERFSFAEARNLCGRMATKDWIFWVDADEFLCEAQHDGIRFAAESHGGGVGGFRAGQAAMSRFPKMVGEAENEYINMRQLRMYRNGCGFWWEGYAHEQIEPSIHAGGYTVVDTSIIVVHNGYSVDDATLTAKLERNSTLIGRWIADNNAGHPLATFYKGLLCRDLSAQLKLKGT